MRKITIFVRGIQLREMILQSNSLNDRMDSIKLVVNYFTVKANGDIYETGSVVMFEHKPGKAKALDSHLSLPKEMADNLREIAEFARKEIRKVERLDEEGDQ